MGSHLLTYSDLIFLAASFCIAFFCILFGIWIGFRMRGKTEGNPSATEPFLKPKTNSKPFARFGMSDYITDAFDLEERPDAIPIKKPGG